jgi:DnaJ-class molecular chaperone
MADAVDRDFQTTETTTIPAAFRMEQVDAPARSMISKMKRELPVTCCTECGGAGYNIRVANGRCCKTSGEQRCSGVNAIAAKTSDWSACTQCQASGYYRNKECPNCKGVGYLLVGLTDNATV